MTITASAVNSPIEALLDRTATLVPATFTHYSASPGTWTKPAHALWVHFQLIGGGGGGGCYGNATNLPGGGGGGAGQYHSVWMPAAALPSTLTCTCGAGGAGSMYYGLPGDRGGKTTIADGATVLFESWGGFGGYSENYTEAYPGYGTFHIARGGMSGEGSPSVGAGGVGSMNSQFGWPPDVLAGHLGRGGAGGESGAFTTDGVGQGGTGAGAGGGGAGSSVPSGPLGEYFINGGGGGGGGFLYSGAANASDSTTSGGGAGSRGLVIITTFCGVDLR